MAAPRDAISYYLLPKENQRIRDMIAAIRADEACHRDLNHHFADIPSWRDVENHEVTILEDEKDDVSSLKFEHFKVEDSMQRDKNQ